MLKHSEESNITPRSITVWLILIDLGKCSVANPFHAKSMALVLSSFLCSLLLNIHVFTFEMHCSMLLIVSTICYGVDDMLIGNHSTAYCIFCVAIFEIAQLSQAFLK